MSEIATLAGGCFWCLEAVYEELRGVEKVVSGYMGGTVASPSYEQVCTGKTGHAEVVQLTYDPAVVSYDDLLRVFFTIHDPTQLDRQGADIGTQYRSAVFHHSPAQLQAAQQVIAELSGQGLWDKPVVTQVVPASPFYPAEDYHQQYFANHPAQPYCAFTVAPKVAKFRKKFYEKLKNQ